MPLKAPFFYLQPQGYKMKTLKESKVEIRTLLLTHLWCSDRRRSRPPSSHRWAPSRLEDRRRRSGTGRGARTRSPSLSGPPKEERGASVLGNLLRVCHPIDSRSRPITMYGGMGWIHTNSGDS